jgi:hypothetical protein
MYEFATIKTFTKFDNSVNSLSFSHDGKFLVASSEDKENKLYIINIATGI